MYNTEETSNGINIKMHWEHCSLLNYYFTIKMIIVGKIFVLLVTDQFINFVLLI